MRHAIALALCLLSASCNSVTPQIVTKEVDIAVPTPCSPKIAKPAAPIARSKADVWAMLSKAPNITEKSRIVADQLLLWLQYGPQLEAAVQACESPKPPQ